MKEWKYWLQALFIVLAIGAAFVVILLTTPTLANTDNATNTESITQEQYGYGSR